MPSTGSGVEYIVTSCVLVLTTLNEIEALRSIWDKIPFELFSRVLVVDGHSTDGTLEFLKGKDCEIITQKLPGRGTGVREVLEHVNEESVMLLASDGNDDPTYIPIFLRKFQDGCDLVIGSRFMKGGATDDSDDPYRVRRFGNRFLTSLVNLFWRAGLTDSTYGLRVFQLDAWRRMKIDAVRNETEYMMSIRAAKLKLKIVQISVVEGRRIGGSVKARTWATGWSLLTLIFSELIKGNNF